LNPTVVVAFLSKPHPTLESRTQEPRLPPPFCTPPPPTAPKIMCLPCLCRFRGARMLVIPLPPGQPPTVSFYLQSSALATPSSLRASHRPLLPKVLLLLPIPLPSIDPFPLPLSSSIPTRKFPSPQTLPPPANRTTLSLRSSSAFLFAPLVIDLAIPGSILGRPLHSSCWRLFSQLVDEPASSLVSQHLRHLDREGGGAPTGGKGSVWWRWGGTSTRLLAPNPYINHTDSADCDKKRKLRGRGREGGREGGSGA
jgi:hypothetical protein